MKTETNGAQIGAEYKGYTFHETGQRDYVRIYNCEGSLCGSGMSEIDCRNEVDRLVKG